MVFGQEKKQTQVAYRPLLSFSSSWLTSWVSWGNLRCLRLEGSSPEAIWASPRFRLRLSATASAIPPAPTELSLRASRPRPHSLCAGLTYWAPRDRLPAAPFANEQHSHTRTHTHTHAKKLLEPPNRRREDTKIALKSKQSGRESGCRRELTQTLMTPHSGQFGNKHAGASSCSLASRIPHLVNFDAKLPLLKLNHVVEPRDVSL